MKVVLDRGTGDRTSQEILHADVDVPYPELRVGFGEHTHDSVTDGAKLTSTIGPVSSRLARSPDFVPIAACETLESGCDFGV